MSLSKFYHQLLSGFIQILINIEINQRQLKWSKFEAILDDKNVGMGIAVGTVAVSAGISPSMAVVRSTLWLPLYEIHIDTKTPILLICDLMKEPTHKHQNNI